MFLRRQQSAHKWTTAGPDPQLEKPSSSNSAPSWSSTSRLAQQPISRQPQPAAAEAVRQERWNAKAEVEPVRGGISLLKRSDSADHVVYKSPTSSAPIVRNWSVDAEGQSSTGQHQPQPAAAPALNQNLGYRPVKFQFQKQAEPTSHWNQVAAVDGFRGGATSSSSAGFTDL